MVLHNIDWSDEMELIYVCQTKENTRLLDLPVFEELKREIYDLLCLEEAKPNEGILKGHSFSDIEIFMDY